jgi:hypothetical protein
MSFIILLVMCLINLFCSKMTTYNKKCTTDELEVQVKASAPRRFKAGAELSGKVNRISVEVNEDQTEEMETIEVKLVLSRESCVACDCQD